MMTLIPKQSHVICFRVPIDWVPRIDALTKQLGLCSRAEGMKYITGAALMTNPHKPVTMQVDSRSGLVVQNPTGNLASSNGAAVPRTTITPQERRIIFSKLDEVYDVRAGYESTWTDFRLAEHLHVPLSFVRQVREEMFGPLQSNPEIDAGIKQAQIFLTDLDKHNEHAIDALERAQTYFTNTLKKIAEERERIETRIAELKASVGK
jgi:hypothetical protein